MDLSSRVCFVYSFIYVKLRVTILLLNHCAKFENYIRKSPGRQSVCMSFPKLSWCSLLYLPRCFDKILNKQLRHPLSCKTTNNRWPWISLVVFLKDNAWSPSSCTRIILIPQDFLWHVKINWHLTCISSELHDIFFYYN